MGLKPLQALGDFPATAMELEKGVWYIVPMAHKLQFKREVLWQFFCVHFFFFSCLSQAPRGEGDCWGGGGGGEGGFMINLPVGFFPFDF